MHTRFTLLTLALVGCGDLLEYDFTPTYPTEQDRLCDPQEKSTCPGVAIDHRAGAAVELAIMGTGPGSLENSRAVKVLGAPDAKSFADDRYGFSGHVLLYELDRGTGAAKSDPPQVLVPEDPTTGGPPATTRMGAALLAADLLPCLSFGPHDYDCGEELMIGAPGDSSVAGNVSIYEPYVVGDSEGVGFYDFVQAPSPSAGDDFGWAIATQPLVAQPDHPWLPAPTVAAWVAIGAPGADEVHLYTVDWTAPTLLTHLQTVTSPFGSNVRFGEALTVGDFDDDGRPDLAVGAPSTAGLSAGPGRVAVYRGVASGVDPNNPLVLDSWTSVLHDADPAVDSRAAFPSDRFGSALASGDFLPEVHGADLLIGAPALPDATGAEIGAVCWVSLDCPAGRLAVDGAIQCRENPVPTGGNDHYGFSVAVGNFESVDSKGSQNTPEARKPEVAIGVPGHANVGRVYLTRTSWSVDALDAVSIFDGGTTDGRYGAALAAGYVSRAPWEDVVIGAPDALTVGEATVTRAHDLVSCEGKGVTPVGYYTLVDHGGTERTLTIWVDEATSTTHLVFQDGFELIATDGGTVCTDEGGSDARGFLPAGKELVFHEAWPCGTSSKTFDVWPSELMKEILVSLDLYRENVIKAIDSDGPVQVELEWTVGPPDTLDMRFDLSAIDMERVEKRSGIDADCTFEDVAGQRLSYEVCDI